MPERRTEKRAESTDRRDMLRPPLWLNLTLLSVGVATLFFARHQRREIDADFARVFDKTSAGPSELNEITAELAEMNLTQGALEKELEGRLAHIESLKSRDFYLSIDTARKRFYLKSGNDTVRGADVRIGAPVALKGPNANASNFAAFKGAFTVAGKTLKNGSGKYVILLPNDCAIYSPSEDRGPLKGPKPGSFIVPEADLQAIWDRITLETRVYIF